MADLHALEAAACPACGGRARWDPARQALVCPYCGTEAPGELDPDTGAVRELDLVAALRELPDDERGWQAEKRSVRCKSCHAVSVFDPERVGQNCGFCGSPELVDYREIKAPLRPRSVIPFRVPEPEVGGRIRKWLAGKWLAPGSLRKRARVESARGVYLPYWTFDAHADARWTAQSGTYYFVTRTARGSDGRPRQVQERRVRWSPAAGALRSFFDDEPVPGSAGVHAPLLRGIEPFPFADLVPYDTAYLSGFVVEHYQVVLIQAAQKAREAMEAKLRSQCAAQIPGDTHRDLRVEAAWSGQTFKHVLVPVWLLTYDYARKTFQVVVNGATGAAAGEYPRSPWRVALLVLGILAVVALIVLFVSRG
jgi:hypothetical protein